MVRQIKEDLRITAILADVEKPEQGGRDVPGIAVDEREDAEPHS
jgi:hypothetical protein